MLAWIANLNWSASPIERTIPGHFGAGMRSSEYHHMDGDGFIDQVVQMGTYILVALTALKEMLHA